MFGFAEMPAEPRQQQQRCHRRPRRGDGRADGREQGELDEEIRTKPHGEDGGPQPALAALGDSIIVLVRVLAASCHCNALGKWPWKGGAKWPGRVLPLASPRRLFSLAKRFLQPSEITNQDRCPHPGCASAGARLGAQARARTTHVPVLIGAVARAVGRYAGRAAPAAVCERGSDRWALAAMCTPPNPAQRAAPKAPAAREPRRDPCARKFRWRVTLKRAGPGLRVVRAPRRDAPARKPESGRARGPQEIPEGALPERGGRLAAPSLRARRHSAATLRPAGSVAPQTARIAGPPGDPTGRAALAYLARAVPETSGRRCDLGGDISRVTAGPFSDRERPPSCGDSGSCWRLAWLGAAAVWT